MCRRRQFGHADLADAGFGFTVGAVGLVFAGLTASDRVAALVRYTRSGQDSTLKPNME